MIVKIQSQLVGQSLFPDMSLIIRYSWSLVGQSIEIDVCDSTGNKFVLSNVSVDLAIGCHRIKM